MSYILITNSDGVSLSLVHADDEGAYLAHHGVKGQRWGVRRFQNPDGSLTEKGKRRMKTLQGKSDKLDAKKAKLNSQKNMIKPSFISKQEQEYNSLLSAHYHTAANQHKADEDFYRNKASYAITNHGSKVATKKADKAHTKYVKNAKRAAKYDDYFTKHQNKEAKIDRKKIKVESKLNPLKEIDAEYARSLAEKVDKRKDKK